MREEPGHAQNQDSQIYSQAIQGYRKGQIAPAEARAQPSPPQKIEAGSPFVRQRRARGED
jgi:hypothetical protein